MFGGFLIAGRDPVAPESLETVSVSLGDRSYQIVIGEHLLAKTAEIIESWWQERGLPESGRKAAIITDDNVAQHAVKVSNSLHARHWHGSIFPQRPGETSKQLDVIASMYDQMVQMQADRQTLVIAVGGGVIGDAAGFLAATYARGLPFLQIPTTLLADVDSSVGGKVGVNHPHAKNLIGAFHQPMGVIIDTTVLQTLPDREYRAGLAEVVKYGVILDADFFSYLEQHAQAINQRNPDALRKIIARSCRLKADVVEQDEFERTGQRAALNYGHTFGHAFEALSGYGQLLHGEAVAIGMIYASRLAERMGRISAQETQRQRELLDAFGLPTRLPEEIVLSPEEILECMRLDKKSKAGRLRFVLPNRIGQVELLQNVSEEDVHAVLKEMSC